MTGPTQLRSRHRLGPLHVPLETQRCRHVAVAIPIVAVGALTTTFAHGYQGRQQFFIKVTNLSPQREVEITRLWFETNPPTQILNPVRPLPARLRLDETFETWIPVADVPTVDDLERMVRVQLSNGKVVKSRLNKGVPPTGYIAGPGSS
jgi:hypothetical protein